MDIASELRALARNLWWSWHPSVIALLRDLDPELWRKVNHNPIAFLAQLPQDELERRASDLALEARINYAFRRQGDYLRGGRRWGDLHCGPLHTRPVAYFSAEFGLHESFPIYSGGLGILAGDHLKSASDLGIPVIGVGLMYAQGYFDQRLDASGWQQESYFETDITHLPLEEATVNDAALRVQVDPRGGRILLRVWRVPVGRSSLLLLDSDVEGNTPADRGLTGRLYGGDSRARIRQELILGVGGVRALRALGVRPGVVHLNEGHSVFSLLEMARQEMVEDGVGFEEGWQRTKARTAFTTHTPVEAGHDRFPPALVEETLGPIGEGVGLSLDALMGLGRVNPADGGEPFCMTVLGLRGAARSNAVSALHGRVTRRMWRGLWPGRAESEVPVGHITNGVHVSSWLAPPMRQLFDATLGADWEVRMGDPETWAPVSAVDDGELWEAHQVLKARLVRYVQRQVCAQESLRNGTDQACSLTAERLSPHVLTIGMARRFATYKRAHLLLTDEERFERLVKDTERPVQIIFAGKAHPQDEPGKHLIQRIFRMTCDERFMGRVVFLEDYDINVARHLVQGVDMWLNVPRRPREASGTSGMKALFNGVLNCSILDGWWAEAYDGQNGFAVGHGGQHVAEDEQDRRDAEALYSLLETHVVPLYYDRDDRGVPIMWVDRMKHALRSLAWRFNAARMAADYARECYLPLAGACNSHASTHASPG